MCRLAGDLATLTTTKRAASAARRTGTQEGREMEVWRGGMRTWREQGETSPGAQNPPMQRKENFDRWCT